VEFLFVLPKPKTCALFDFPISSCYLCTNFDRNLSLKRHLFPKNKSRNPKTIMACVIKSHFAKSSLTNRRLFRSTQQHTSQQQQRRSNHRSSLSRSKSDANLSLISSYHEHALTLLRSTSTCSMSSATRNNNNDNNNNNNPFSSAPPSTICEYPEDSPTSRRKSSVTLIQPNLKRLRITPSPDVADEPSFLCSSANKWNAMLLSPPVQNSNVDTVSSSSSSSQHQQRQFLSLPASRCGSRRSSITEAVQMIMTSSRRNSVVTIDTALPTQLITSALTHTAASFTSKRIPSAPANFTLTLPSSLPPPPPPPLTLDASLLSKHRTKSLSERRGFKSLAPLTVPITNVENDEDTTEDTTTQDQKDLLFTEATRILRTRSDPGYSHNIADRHSDVSIHHSDVSARIDAVHGI